MKNGKGFMLVLSTWIALCSISIACPEANQAILRATLDEVKLSYYSTSNTSSLCVTHVEAPRGFWILARIVNVVGESSDCSEWVSVNDFKLCASASGVTTTVAIHSSRLTVRSQLSNVDSGYSIMYRAADCRLISAFLSPEQAKEQRCKPEIGLQEPAAAQTSHMEAELVVAIIIGVLALLLIVAVCCFIIYTSKGKRPACCSSERMCPCFGTKIEKEQDGNEMQPKSPVPSLEPAKSHEIGDTYQTVDRMRNKDMNEIYENQTAIPAQRRPSQTGSTVSTTLVSNEVYHNN